MSDDETETATLEEITVQLKYSGDAWLITAMKSNILQEGAAQRFPDSYESQR